MLHDSRITIRSEVNSQRGRSYPTEIGPFHPTLNGPFYPALTAYIEAAISARGDSAVRYLNRAETALRSYDGVPERFKNTYFKLIEDIKNDLEQ